jgi:hypothetical protein
MNRRRNLVALFLVALAPLACNQQAPRDAPEPDKPEATLAEQASAVRDGQSDQIRLNHTMVTDDDLRLLDGLEDKLERINFSHSEITDEGLARLCRFPLLTQLRLASSRVDDAGLAALAELKHLRHLHLIDVPLTDAGLEHLHALKNLESLYLDHTRASDEGIGRLVQALPGVHLHIDHEHHRLDPQPADHIHPPQPPTGK